MKTFWITLLLITLIVISMVGEITHEYSFVDGVYEKNALCISGVAYARNGGTLLRDVQDKPRACITKVLTPSEFNKEKNK